MFCSQALQEKAEHEVRSFLGSLWVMVMPNSSGRVSEQPGFLIVSWGTRHPVCVLSKPLVDISTSVSPVTEPSCSWAPKRQRHLSCLWHWADGNKAGRNLLGFGLLFSSSVQRCTKKLIFSIWRAMGRWKIMAWARRDLSTHFMLNTWVAAV